MCGISGFLDERPATRASREAAVSAMADALRHRGPDDGGTWVDAEAGIALGHRRLAIIDISAGGHQPMATASCSTSSCLRARNTSLNTPPL